MSDTVDAAIVTETPTVIDGAAEAVTPKTEPKQKRIKKNHTDTKIDPNNPQTIEDYLSEFYAQSFAQAARKGYDQHWNKEGFIHAGPAVRLPNRGAAQMMAFLIDILADRATMDDPTLAAEAKAFLDAMIAFASGRIVTKRAEKNKIILDKAAAINANGN